MPTPKLTTEIISAAIEGFESKKRRIDEQIAELRAMLSGGPAETATTTPEATPGKRKKFSAASRRKMALAQKARWAKIKGESEAPAPAPAQALRQARRKLSPAAKAKLVANLKKARAAKAAKAKSAATK